MYYDSPNFSSYKQETSMNKKLFILSLLASIWYNASSAMLKNELALVTKVITANKTQSISHVKNENIARLFSSSPNRKNKANLKKENQIKNSDSKDNSFDDFLRMAAVYKYGGAGHVLADMYLDDGKDKKNTEPTTPTKYKTLTDEELQKETTLNEKHLVTCLKKSALGFAAGGIMMTYAPVGTITNDLGVLTLMATSGYFLLNIGVNDEHAKEICREKEQRNLEKNKNENQN